MLVNYFICVFRGLEIGLLILMMGVVVDGLNKLLNVGNGLN